MLLGAGAGVGREIGAGREKRERRRRPISFTLFCKSAIASSLLRAMSSNFFGKKSNAPASSASRVAVAPSRVSDENIKIGVGVAAIISFTALMPSRTGISTSIVITSGFNSRALSTASRPFTAKPIT